MKLRLLSLTVCLAATLAPTARAQNLLALYDAAKGHDAAFKAAQSQYQATLARAEQARALMRPTVGLGANLSETDLSNNTLNRDFRYGTRSATLSASQPLYRPANEAGRSQGLKQLDLAEAQLLAAEQDLMVRLSQAYFDVLTADATLASVKAQKTAVSEQLAAAKRNFEVGTATITDTREAQARFDLVVAQEIAAENDLRVRKLALDQTTGTQGASPHPLGRDAALAMVSGDIESWVQQAGERNPAVRQARTGLEIASLETAKAQAAHRPTLDLTAGYNLIRYRNPIPGSQSDTSAASVGLAFNLPLYAGGSLTQRVQETVALEQKARNDLDAAQRNIAQATRSAYLGVQSGLGQVNALKAAEASSQSALDANKLGYQVGVRINIDVLNSQSQLFQTQRDLARARHEVVLAQLRLRQAAGTLQASDLQGINGLLQKP
ncbi:MAG: TolC family outer membrane protein [Limnohabitans sp.]